MTALRLAVRQSRFEQLSFWRNPAAAFFTFAFPLMFLVILTSLLGNDTATLPSGEEVKASTYYIGSTLAFSVVTASYTNIAMGTSIARDLGVLKRIKGTPVPPAAYLGGRVLSSLAVTALLVAIVLVFGRVVYDISLPDSTAPAFAVTMVLGAFAFSALGLAITAVVPNADAAPAIVNATVLPLLFVSGIFIPIDDGPQWIRTVSEIFPVRHFLVAALDTFLGAEETWPWKELAIITAWGLGGLAAAARWFSWEPRT